MEQRLASRSLQTHGCVGENLGGPASLTQWWTGYSWHFNYHYNLDRNIFTLTLLYMWQEKLIKSKLRNHNMSKILSKLIDNNAIRSSRTQLSIMGNKRERQGHDE